VTPLLPWLVSLWDKRSAYCIIDKTGCSIGDGIVTTSAEAMRAVFGGTGRMRIALECGTHSPWVSRLLEELGHEVIVANPRRLRLTVRHR
jgi:transposase